MNEIQEKTLRVAYGATMTCNTIKHTKALEAYKRTQRSLMDMIVTRNLIEFDGTIHSIKEMVELAEMNGLHSDEIHHIYTALDSVIPFMQELRARLKVYIDPSFLEPQETSEEEQSEW